MVMMKSIEKITNIVGGGKNYAIESTQKIRRIFHLVKK
jgi:hypothetical protein